jgi:hypothetical protein
MLKNFETIVGTIQMHRIVSSNLQTGFEWVGPIAQFKSQRMVLEEKSEAWQVDMDTNSRSDLKQNSQSKDHMRLKAVECSG